MLGGATSRTLLASARFGAGPYTTPARAAWRTRWRKPRQNSKRHTNRIEQPCYHFATQPVSTRRNEPVQPTAPNTENLRKAGLFDTAQHGAASAFSNFKTGALNHSATRPTPSMRDRRRHCKPFAQLVRKAELIPLVRAYRVDGATRNHRSPVASGVCERQPGADGHVVRT